MLDAAISVDVDTLASLYNGRGCTRPGGYSGEEFRIGLENLCIFLETYGIKATFFMVGRDFLDLRNHPAIRELVARGHEIANHTYSHAQGFRRLSPEEKEREIAAMEEVCLSLAGRRPVGFRSPGWNVSDDALPILRQRGYLYDSSVFPSYLNPLLKFLHWQSTRACPPAMRTTLGQPGYMFAPLLPYRTSAESLGKPGAEDFVELPVTVIPFARLPFSATFHLFCGQRVFQAGYRLLKGFGLPLQYQFHLTDFVELSRGSITREIPWGEDVYVPRAFKVPLEKKLDFYRAVVETIAADYSFTTLEQWARALA